MPTDIMKLADNRALHHVTKIPSHPQMHEKQTFNFNELYNYNFFFKSVNKRILDIFSWSNLVSTFMFITLDGFFD